jgi:PBSX family phage terminase large subunit
MAEELHLHQQKVELKLLPKQRKFLESTKKEVMYSGGFGAGKSICLCIKAAMEASKKGNVVLLIRKTLVSLRKSTLRSLIEEDDKNPPILPLGTYTFNKSAGEIKLNGGGTIIICGMDNPTRLRSINAGCVIIDEAIELNEDEYNTLFSRLRLNVGSRQIVMATNPGPQSHFLYKRFFLENSNNREVINAPTNENFLLPQDYLESLMDSYKGNELLYKKYVLGQWVTAENSVYPTFNRDIHVKNINYESDRYYLGLDFGFTNATAMSLVQVAGSKVVVLEEVHKSKLLQSEIMQHLHDFDDRYKGLTVIYDPSAASLGAQIQHEGINCVKANNDITLGISRINTKLAVREDTGEPDLYINPNCVNLIREMENYQYDKSGSEKPIKVNDHQVDNLRYVINHLYDSNATEFKYFSLGASDDDD